MKSREKKCKICKNKISGRSDRIFCSIKCKNYYHVNLRKVTNEATRTIDEILHRNRSILLELMGKNTVQKKVDRTALEFKKFRFKYMTHYHTNKHGKIYNYIYDFAWMEFSSDIILIVRKK